MDPLPDSQTPLDHWIARLDRALNSQPDQSRCDDIQAILPTLGSEEMAGLRISERYPDLAHHLETCERCGPAYAQLLDDLMADARGDFAVPEAVPPPRLPRTLAVQRWMIRMARTVLQADLFALEVLPDVARVYFGKVTDVLALPELGLISAPALGLGDDVPALHVLAAIHQTVAHVLRGRTSEQVVALERSGELEGQVRQIARLAAQTHQLSATETLQVVDVVTRELRAQTIVGWGADDVENA